MFKSPNHQQAGRNIFMSSAIGLANVIAVVCAFLGTPWLHTKTSPWVVDHVGGQYGAEFEDITNLLWFVICALVIFFGARASIATAIVFGALTIATRLL